MKRLIVALACVALLLMAILWLVWPDASEQGQIAAVPRVELEPRDVVLYFADPGGLYLVSEERKIAGCNDERQCVAQMFEAQAAGSATLQPVVPARTRVLNVAFEGDLARVSFSRELVDQHPGGTLTELLTVYALTDTLAVNFPYLHRLQILIDGQIVPTLKGHVDIARPIAAEFRYSQAPREAESSTGTGAIPAVPDQAVTDGAMAPPK